MPNSLNVHGTIHGVLIGGMEGNGREEEWKGSATATYPMVSVVEVVVQVPLVVVSVGNGKPVI